jgi:hypothetical protein
MSDGNAPMNLPKEERGLRIQHGQKSTCLQELVQEPLADPDLELYDGNGSLIALNGNWRLDQEGEILATSIPPSSSLESAIVRSLAPGHYTAIVRGADDTIGIAVVEAYGLN